MVKEDYVVKNLYQPGYSSFSSENKNLPMHYSGFSAPASQMGMTVNPGVANQLSELNKALNTGAVPIEVGTISWDLWESIPEEHFHEMRRKADLAGAKISLHAPIQGMDPSGFTDKGWDAGQQQLVEHQLKDVVEKAAIIDKSGSMPITIHGSNFAGSTWKYDINPETGKREKMYDQMIAVDKKTGQAVPIKADTQYDMGREGIIEKTMSVEDGLDSHNSSTWRKECDATMERTNSLNQYFDEKHVHAQELYGQVKSGDRTYEELMPTEKRMYNEMNTAQAKFHDAYLGVNTLFNKAVEYSEGDQERIDKLNELSKNFSQEMETNPDLHGQTVAMQTLTEGLRKVRPEMFQTVEDFSKKKAAETFANVAMHSYNTAGENAPVISIENLDQGRMGFSNGQDLADLSQNSRDKFAEQLMNQGKSESEANRIAEKMIGVTFDVGHLNLSRKYGFTEEELVKEAAALKEHVKHVHLTDNFGFADSHLPIGMGNVPVKELMEALGEGGEKARKINEVGGWFQISQESPFPYLLQASGSQVYSSGGGPAWSQNLGFQQSYSQGGGMMLPSSHYSMFGAGFSQLPQELGGSVGGAGGGRMGGGGY